jgi:hypothetical protein
MARRSSHLVWRLSCALPLLLTIPTLCFAQTTISPGLWQISVQLNTEALAMLPVTVNQCLTAADAKDPSKLLGSISNPGASGCSYTNRSYSGNTFSFSMTCSGSFGISATGNVSFTPTTMSGTINTSANINGEPVEMRNVVMAKRLGDC